MGLLDANRQFYHYHLYNFSLNNCFFISSLENLMDEVVCFKNS